MAEEARYLYSVAKTAIEVNLGEIGIEKKEVFTIPYKDIAALVHSSLAEPYDTKDRTRAEEWILEHSYVIDQAMKRFESVLPFSFDVILKGDNSAIAGWLEKNYLVLHKNIEKVEGKAEYGIQIYYNYNDLAGKILEDDPELTNQTLGKIKTLAAELKMDDKKRKADGYKGMTLLVSYICLVADENVLQLGETLDEINRREGFRVRFTGPWAPFSFVDYRELS